jgi:hypothetical protein
VAKPVEKMNMLSIEVVPEAVNPKDEEEKLPPPQ